MKLIKTPVPGFTGDVGGVHFFDGAAKVSDDAQELSYFLSAGYGIEEYAEAKKAADDEETEKLENLPEQSGTATTDPVRFVTTEDQGVLVLPRRSASTETWRTFAVEQGGMKEKDVRDMSRDDLADKFYDAPENSTEKSALATPITPKGRAR